MGGNNRPLVARSLGVPAASASPWARASASPGRTASESSATSTPRQPRGGASSAEGVVGMACLQGGPGRDPSDFDDEEAARRPATDDIASFVERATRQPHSTRLYAVRSTRAMRPATGNHSDVVPYAVSEMSVERAVISREAALLASALREEVRDCRRGGESRRRVGHELRHPRRRVDPSRRHTVVIAPGSRSTPFATAIADRPELSRLSHSVPAFGVARRCWWARARRRQRSGSALQGVAGSGQVHVVHATSARAGRPVMA
jgi:hypothetical protein